jgi:hypothetical protein
MPDRRVNATGKNAEGDITSLCLTDAAWSPRSKYLAIEDIESRAHTYYVLWRDKRTEIHVVQGATGKYLRTDYDTTPRNNLDDLPDC